MTGDVIARENLGIPDMLEFDNNGVYMYEMCNSINSNKNRPTTNISISTEVSTGDAWRELMSNEYCILGTLHEDFELINKVKKGGYPNVYGARIPVRSVWNLKFLDKELVDYGDRELLEFIRYGWPSNRIPQALRPTISRRNHPSANQYPEYVRNYIIKEIQLGAVMGPFRTIPFADRVGISPLSTRPKRDSNDRRTIMDLSFPPCTSVNDYTSKVDYLGLIIQLQYPTVDDLSQRVAELGTEAHIWKRDLQWAFRWVPWDPGDWELFGFVWEELYFWNKMLVMGACIAPYIMQRITNAIAYIHRKNGNHLLNYIDDFVGAELREQAWKSFIEMKQLLCNVGVPESPDKAVEPGQLVEFLGILFNVLAGTIEISADRLVEIREILIIWEDKIFCTRKELESLIGKLQFAATCVRPGRVFIARLLNMLRGMTRDNTYNVDAELKKDVKWWKEFMAEFNGVCIMWPEQRLQPDEVMATDASLVGAGAVAWNHAYYRLKFPPCWVGKNIAYLEMWAIIVACKVWGSTILKGKKLVVQCDNEAVVEIINRGRSRDIFLQAALQEIVYLAAVHQFELRCVHIMGALNRIPDMLSRWPMGGSRRRTLREYWRDHPHTRTRTGPHLLSFTNNW